MVGRSFNLIKEKTFDQAIPKIITESRDYIKDQLRDFQYLSHNGTFETMPEYPEFAWFEGIVNALTHRNYSIRGQHITVTIFDDHLEIKSPGVLPNIVTIENILNERFSRNPKIARILAEFGWVKEMNEGVKRIYTEMASFFLNKPQYSEPNKSSVLLLLENNILNRQVRITDKIRNQISSEKFADLTEHEKHILHLAHNSGKITSVEVASFIGKSRPYATSLLKKLTNEGLLTWHGASPKDPTQYYSFNHSFE